MSREEPFPGDQGGAFPSTHWSAVALAADAVADGAGTSQEARAALDGVLRRYLPALKVYLRSRRRLDPHRAEDLLQGFVAERILEKNLLARADRGRGRFRSFLVACLARYAAEHQRRSAAATRRPATGDPLPLEAAFDAVDDLVDEGGEAFDVAWAKQVIAEALGRMRATCDSSGRPDLWALFEGRVVRPSFGAAPPLDYAELVRRFSFTSVAQATAALATAKRMFARHLRETVREYLGEDAPPEEVEEELLCLKRALGRSARSRAERA